jgi:hypothetical protein
MSAAARAGAALAALVLAAGCTGVSQEDDYHRRVQMLDMTDTLRKEALGIQNEGQREKLVSGLVVLRDLMLAEPDASAGLKMTDVPPPGSPRLPGPDGADQPVPPWCEVFLPRSLVIGFFTRSKNFDSLPGDDGLEVRLQPLDQFGDPVKAVGSYRVEVFAYRLHTSEKRGDRLGHWFVSVLDVESNRRYYDPVDRSYVFPLLWDKEIPQGTAVVVQATFYPPAGFQEKLFAQRVIRIGAESD